MKAERERLKRDDIVFPRETATWTEGPSLPMLRPEAIARGG